jgi:hypothetical protein
VSLTVTILDHATGDTETAEVPDGDYLIVVTEPATESVQVYPNGTHVITVKGRQPATHSGSSGGES